MRSLSKSKIIAFRQCPKRLWLEIHYPELAVYSAAAQKAFFIGHQVGDIARHLYDPKGTGNLLDAQTEGYDEVFARTRALLDADHPTPIFEAGFCAGGALAFADVLLPTANPEKPWRMIEVKSAASVKDYYLDDTAIQSWVAAQGGVALESVSVAHIDSTWVYPGQGDYRGLLKAVDVTEEAFSRHPQVTQWIKDAQHTAALPEEPPIKPGKQCNDPNPCGFIDYCNRDMAPVECPVTWLPNFRQKKIDQLAEIGVHDLRDVPDDYLTATQKLVRDSTIRRERYFELDATRKALSIHPFPALFLDFETSNLAIPIWAGTRPFEQTPFQYSLHILNTPDDLTHREYIDLSGNNPARGFAESLITDCGLTGPLFVYNASFESGVISRLAEKFADLKPALDGINARLVDLQPIAKNHHYHPDQQGSWSIKNLVPTIDPTLNYANLEGVQHGQMAIEAFTEAIAPTTSAQRKTEIRQQLLEYCKLDTLAMVRVWEAFMGFKKLD